MSEFILPNLPYAMDALAPVMSKETIEYHYGKHHQSYVTNLNKLIKGTEWEDKPLKEIILKAKGGIFNNAAQVYNHNYFWKCMTPNGGGEPAGALRDAIVAKWGDVAAFVEAFSAAAAGNFGSGWTWLVEKEDGTIDIFSPSNADNPIVHGMRPLLTIDVWEHAYYIDYRNARPKFIAAFFDKLVNWKYVEDRFNGAPCGCGSRAETFCCCGGCH